MQFLVLHSACGVWSVLTHILVSVDPTCIKLILFLSVLIHVLPSAL